MKKARLSVAVTTTSGRTKEDDEPTMMPRHLRRKTAQATALAAQLRPLQDRPASPEAGELSEGTGGGAPPELTRVPSRKTAGQEELAGVSVRSLANLLGERVSSARGVLEGLSASFGSSSLTEVPTVHAVPGRSFKFATLTPSLPPITKKEAESRSIFNRLYKDRLDGTQSPGASPTAAAGGTGTPTSASGAAAADAGGRGSGSAAGTPSGSRGAPPNLRALSSSSDDPQGGGQQLAPPLRQHLRQASCPQSAAPPSLRPPTNLGGSAHTSPSVSGASTPTGSASRAGSRRSSICDGTAFTFDAPASPSGAPDPVPGSRTQRAVSAVSSSGQGSATLPTPPKRTSRRESLVSVSPAGTVTRPVSPLLPQLSPAGASTPSAGTPSGSASAAASRTSGAARRRQMNMDTSGDDPLIRLTPQTRLYTGQRVRVGATEQRGTVFFFGETSFGPGNWAGVLLDVPHASDVALVEADASNLPDEAGRDLDLLVGKRPAQRCVFAPADGRVSSLVPDRLILVSPLKRAMVAVRAFVRWCGVQRTGQANRILRLRDERGGGGRHSTPFDTVDLLATESPQDQERTIEKLVSYLTMGPLAKTDALKLRAIFRWVCAHVTYSAKHSKVTDPTEVLATRLCCALGFSSLVAAMAREAGFPCVVVRGLGRGEASIAPLPPSDAKAAGARSSGTSKDPTALLFKLAKSPAAAAAAAAAVVPSASASASAGARSAAGKASGPGKKSTFAHWWCLVYVDGRWQPMDPTWSSGYVAADGHWRLHWNDAYFLPPPDLFIKQHLPQHIETSFESLPAPRGAPPMSSKIDAQLLNQMPERNGRAVELEEFEGAAVFSRAFVQYRMKMIHPACTMNIQHTTPYYTISLEAPTNLEYLVEVRQVSGASVRDKEPRVLNSCWHVQTIAQGRTGSVQSSVFLVFPERGDYVITLQCKVIQREVFHWQRAFRMAISTSTGIRDIPVNVARNVWVGFIKRRRYHGRDSNVETQFRLLSPFKGYFELGAPFSLVIMAPTVVEGLICVNNGRWWRLSNRAGGGTQGTAADPLADAIGSSLAGMHISSGGEWEAGYSPIDLLHTPTPSGGGGDREPAVVNCLDEDGGDGTVVKAGAVVYQCDVALDLYPEVLVFYKLGGKYKLLYEFMADMQHVDESGRGMYLAPGDRDDVHRTSIVDGVARTDQQATDELPPENETILDGRVVLDTWGRCFEYGLRLRGVRKGRRAIDIFLTSRPDADLRLEGAVNRGWGKGSKAVDATVKVTRDEETSTATESSWTAKVAVPEPDKYSILISVSSSGLKGVFRFALAYYAEIA